MQGSKKNNYISFKEARSSAINLKLKNRRAWEQCCKENKIPQNIRRDPRKYKEWNGWGDWLGNGNAPNYIRKYKINDNYFSQWSSNMAYILGFWFADGYIIEEKNLFGITQHEKDVILIELIKYEFQSTYPIYRSKDSTLILRVTSKKIIKDIIRRGGHNKKSLTMDFPSIPKKYLPDFVRGYFDGDGCVTRNNKKLAVSSFACGSKSFADGLVEALKTNINNFGGYVYTIKEPHRRNIQYRVVLSTNNTRKLRDFMYYDTKCIKMDRKYQKMIKA